PPDRQPGRAAARGDPPTGHGRLHVHPAGTKRFFVAPGDAEQLHTLVIELALHTHWGRADILNLEVDELIASLQIARRLLTPPRT
ncbi:hypothetical protein U5801_26815, partial [Lamprobacter modestohalophilus]